MAFPRLGRQLTAAAAFTCMVSLSAYSAERGPPPHRPLAAVAGWLDEAGLTRLARVMPPGAAALAARLDAAPHADFWGRPIAWRRLALAEPAGLTLKPLDQKAAEKLNAALPMQDLLPRVAPAPFVLRAGGAEQARAVQCLAQAIYYEAALEPLAGQRAVAQTILNRVRHPDFPKSVCGVVYQGAGAPGCQFSFACDGSMARPPIAPYWQQAKAVAEAALGGYVDRDVGPATYYHAAYVFPRWEPDMVRVRQVGAHIFYRYTGPAGTPEALCGRYAGHELGIRIPKPPKLAKGAKLVVAAAARPPGPPQTPQATPWVDAAGRKVGRLNVEAHPPAPARPRLPDEREYATHGALQPPATPAVIIEPPSPSG